MTTERTIQHCWHWESAVHFLIREWVWCIFIIWIWICVTQTNLMLYVIETDRSLILFYLFLNISSDFHSGDSQFPPHLLFSLSTMVLQFEQPFHRAFWLCSVAFIFLFSLCLSRQTERAGKSNRKLFEALLSTHTRAYPLVVGECCLVMQFFKYGFDLVNNSCVPWLASLLPALRMCSCQSVKNFSKNTNYRLIVIILSALVQLLCSH